MAKQGNVEVQVEPEGRMTRTVEVSHASRVIFPATETTRAITKLDMVEYVVKMADPLLGALRDRPTTLERWPNGVQPGMHVGRGKDAAGFYQKHLPRSVPDYVQGVEITFPSGRTAIELCPTEPAVLAWCMQMGTITFHPWPVRRTQNPDSLDKPDELRIDLDPQPGIPFGETVRVALKAGNLLNALGMTGFCKTSGGRGVHIYVPITPDWSFDDVRHAAIAFGRELEQRDDGVTTQWWRELRGDRVFVDFNQNCRDRTIASAWSPRAREGAPVSTPLTWDDLAGLSDPRELNVLTVPSRYENKGNPWQDMDAKRCTINPLLDLWNTNPAEMNFPPDYPKMPGEPKRVQPSRDADRPH